ncbi:CLAVATA3/ESR (CLE)-related protein 19-like [Asparagus officinalis]|uniref:CLAVATA3/ESR (CLE)-related protein 19-like n=1 Tax=Asparagus officinalis TaxID=4686 RepID=UPI00098E7FB1|nr:CLAVATA3/ESR (CLE)-related protein 19-like [Asparagus officinalis]
MVLLVMFSLNKQVLGKEIIGRKFAQAKLNEKSSTMKELRLDNCSFASKEKKCNSTAFDDDKRKVPTGPNPLHNR